MQRRATSLFIGNNTLTIRTFLFSLRLLAPAHACSSIFCVFLFYRGSPGDRGALHCHWNAIATQLGQVPFSQRDIVGLAAAKAGALQINLNIDGCGVVAPPVHAP